MGYEIQKIADLPLVIVTFDEHFGAKEEMVAYLAEINALYDRQPAPVFLIADMSFLSLDFDSLLNFVQLGVRADNAITKHRNNRDILLVTTSRFYQTVAKGLNSATFGHVNLLIYDSIEAAMNYVREQAA
jgi:hypothetical protein